MKLSALFVLALALAACSRIDEEHTREQARQTAEQVKHDSQKALREAEIETKKASRELNRDLETAREKTRHALNQPDQPNNDRLDNSPPDNNARR